MIRTVFVFFCLLPTVFLPAFLAGAQQTGKIFRIGFLDNSSASGNAPLFEAFRQEMRKLGWIEGKNFTLEYRFADRKFDRLPDLAADLVRLKVDLIMVSGGNRRWRPRAPLRLSPL
jgi:putative ABC transport system substrate-binding protein